MTIRNLEGAARPTSVAIIGASPRPGSVGGIVLANVLAAGFEGNVWAVNPKHREIAGMACYRRVADLPAAPDLAVIATPPRTVPGLITELAEKGTRVAVVITAGLNAENGLRQKMLDAARPHTFRIIGPNTVGLLVPTMKLNASFAHMAPASGGLALLSQSGAIATSLIDWAADEGLGFSHIVSLGDQADVDVGDYLDMLAGDAATKAILLYLESIPNPRKFISAARAAARLKPVIAIKSGRHEAAAKAAATHTGALSGADRVVEAALRRAGILRVKGLGSLFDAAETVARFRPLERSRVGIVTNGGGAGVLAVDTLMDQGGELAQLSEATLARLDKTLPATWSKANPVDIIGDAPPERYEAAVRAVAADPDVDCILILNCPTALASPVAAAEGIAQLADRGMIDGKPALTCWLGEETARAGRSILQDAGLASFATPGEAAIAVSYLSDWSRAQRALMRVPSSLSEDVSGDRQVIDDLLRQAAREGRRILTEKEAKGVLAAYGIEVPEDLFAPSPDKVEAMAADLLSRTERIVLKLVSRQISHKSDIGGVVLNIETPEAARRAAEKIAQRVKDERPDARIDGYALQPMIVRPHAQELIIGMSHDPIFGPAILFGTGGVAVEVIDDTAIALPPLDDVLAGDLIDSTRVGRLLAGFRDRKPADRRAIVHALSAVSQLVVDYPAILSLDINPLIADADGAVALDARIEIDPERVGEAGPNRAMAIRPWPSGWSRDEQLGDRNWRLQPIKPTDVELFPAFLAKVSQEDIRLRFLAPRRHFPHQMLVRLTQLDYDREMAFVALDIENGELGGIARISCDPNHETAEFGLLVRTDLQGHGIGRALMEQLLDYARADGIARIEGHVLDENTKMLEMCRRLGFTMKREPQEPGVLLVSCELGLE
ncbi:GNAT family N-acetyltransferase [Chelativorans sp. ZYF759]|uniref:bifunctional acetate--CoA ligase family protein/GNAT family N-acetyltransferase n=1 Tax=Chelativorans sp. ZYF759 TaxID=2692213 RepID=UPI00145EEFC5|nr:bifunctional acetate--CoA ligase family protein/GNAT family N-acetyltransferase [Chelativorans sp. ZYF759]NMG40653.1 GNAT family N-acetyltransferase [Chelativorans sp. ZYF759]